MITLSTISFTEITRKKAATRLADQQLVDQGHAVAVQQKIIFSKIFPAFF